MSLFVLLDIEIRTENKSGLEAKDGVKAQISDPDSENGQSSVPVRIQNLDSPKKLEPFLDSVSWLRFW